MWVSRLFVLQLRTNDVLFCRPAVQGRGVDPATALRTDMAAPHQVMDTNQNMAMWLISDAVNVIQSKIVKCSTWHHWALVA
jgi:hypothetical protein